MDYNKSEVKLNYMDYNKSEVKLNYMDDVN